jgi:hypothetical protein
MKTHAIREKEYWMGTSSPALAGTLSSTFSGGEGWGEEASIKSHSREPRVHGS